MDTERSKFKLSFFVCGVNWRAESPTEISSNHSKKFSVKNNAMYSTFVASYYSKKINFITGSEDEDLEDIQDESRDV